MSETDDLDLATLSDSDLVALPARGLFHDHPYQLGIAGSYFSSLGREMYESADVVLAVGTSLSYYTGAGHFWPQAYKIQLDDDSVRLLKTKQVPDDVWTHVMALRDDIIAGKLKNEPVWEATAVRALMSNVTAPAE